MATRTILTSQPELTCDVCARRLLRGEHADVYLQSGQRRNVCELCAPRAAQEGWRREREIDLETRVQTHERPARGLLRRLRRGAGLAEEASVDAAAEGPSAVEESAPPPAALGEQPTEESIVLATPEAVAEANLLERGVQSFNASEFPRRVRGVARSLGQPEVSIRGAEHLASAVRIVVAWELCWYRYEIDFSEDEPCVRALAQGSELAQLEREERLANASLDDDGTLLLLAGA